MVSATSTCATNEGGADRPAIAAPFRNAGNPVCSRYGTGHIHESAPSAISPASWKAFSPRVEINTGIRGVLGDVTSTLKDLGVNDVIDYKKISFEDRVHDVDVVFDTVGGNTLERSWQVLRKGGKLVSVASQGLPTTFDKLQSYFKEKGDFIWRRCNVVYCSSQQGPTY